MHDGALSCPPVNLLTDTHAFNNTYNIMHFIMDSTDMVLTQFKNTYFSYGKAKTQVTQYDLIWKKGFFPKHFLNKN
jgi:hypothetical protein